MVIANPLGAYGRTGIENNARLVWEFEASGTIGEGDVVMIDTLTSTDEMLSVKEATTTAEPAMIAGVALHDAVSADVVKVVVLGPAIVNVGTNTVAAGQVASRDGTTAGIAAGTTADATTITGDSFGVFLSANDVPSTDKAIVWVAKV